MLDYLLVTRMGGAAAEPNCLGCHNHKEVDMQVVPRRT